MGAGQSHLGEGAFGKAYKVKVNGEKLAVKKIKHTNRVIQARSVRFRFWW